MNKERMIDKGRSRKRQFNAMIVRYAGIALAAIAISAGAGCGLFYQAGREARTVHMRGSLKAGETPLQVHSDWGEPEMRSSAGEAEIWSYAERANTNDIAATLFYTSAKPGDEGKFLDLKFVGGKLVSWNETKHTLPAKQGAGFGYGFGAGYGYTPGGTGGTASPVTHY